jgi:hypothetical protein
VFPLAKDVMASLHSDENPTVVAEARKNFSYLRDHERAPSPHWTDRSDQAQRLHHTRATLV